MCEGYAGNAVVHEGWLCKEGHFRKNWKWRWCVLTLGELRYYKSPSSLKPQGCVSLQGASVIPCVHPTAPQKRTFTIRHKSPKRSYFFQASNITEFTQWLECVKSALPRRVRRLTNEATRNYQAQVLGRASTVAAEELQACLNGMVGGGGGAWNDDGTASRGSLGGDFPASDLIVQAHSDLYTLDKDERDSKVKDALATIVAATCATVWHEVTLDWDDTAFPLGLDFETLQGGHIAVKTVFGGARAQGANIQAGDVVVALNSENIAGLELREFFARIREAAPGSNPVENVPESRGHTKGNSSFSSHSRSDSSSSIGSASSLFSAAPSRRRLETAPVQERVTSAKLSFTIARKLVQDPAALCGRQGSDVVGNCEEGDNLEHLFADPMDGVRKTADAAALAQLALFDWN